MAVNTKTIKRRIKSIGNTRKITKAMEMISAVKMRRAVANVLATRSYAHLAWQMLLDVAKKTDVRLHPLLRQRPVKKIGLILITSNRGLAGGFSSKLLQETDKFIKEAGQQVEVILLGKRGRKIYKNFGHTVAAEYDKIDLTAKIEEILPMAKMTIAEYINGKYNKLCVAYTDYVSAIKQIPRVKQILPLEASAVIPPTYVGGILGGDGLLGQAGAEGNGNSPRPPLGKRGMLTRLSPSSQEGDEEGVAEAGIEFLFEPQPARVLDMLIPRLVEMQIYQAILESDASEHSARMLAMRNASDAAEDIIKELNYTFNKARQSAITQEIAEICGGAAALE